MASSSRTSASNNKTRHPTSKWTWWEEVDSSVSAEGGGGGARPWSCKLCGDKRTGGANKVRAHLLHERGHEVRFCSSITSEKKQELLNKFAISDAQVHARRASQASFVKSSMPSTSRASSSSAPIRAPTPTHTPTPPTPSSTPSGMPYLHQSHQQTLRENWNPILKEEVDTTVARFFYHDHIAFNAARSPYFKDMLKKIGEYGPHYVPPSSENLCAALLEKEKKLVEAACESIKKSWERNGVSLLVDGWKVAYSRGEMYFISSQDASEIGKSTNPTNRATGAIIENLYPHIIDIGNLDGILPPINEANSLNEFSKRSTLALFKYSDTRFAYNFTMLHRVVKCGGVLLGFLLSDEFTRMPEASTSTRKHFKRLADDATWWENISHIVDILHPLEHLLKVLDSMEPCIAEVYEAMDPTIEYEEIAAICVNRWNAYYSPLHAAAYMLDPEFQDKKQYADLEVANGWRIILERLIRDSATRRMPLRIDYVRIRVGAPLWCEDFGFGGPYLQQLAICILSQACTMSCLEQLWSLYGHVYSKKRNRLGVQRASDLVFVSANLRMLRRTRCAEGDPFKEWEVEQVRPSGK
ncbi:hypothetical protein KP509_34G006200 [Ceratopteris richardii]|uniref:BED-type domain-containing protein n=1 Tax=Ceratopteris richardii TaxID=49495 RepID=A0A8T2QJ33_CERRI|nr:hypothetical protein KP509_34G006200 [Ceratopteris richardii]